MRKYIVGAFFGALLSFSVTAFADSGLKEIKAVLWPMPIQMNANGHITNSASGEVEVLNYKDQAYVPLRYVAEKLGATVKYKPRGTDLAQPFEDMITIDNADDRNLNVKDAEGILSLGNFKFTLKPSGTMLTFQIKQNEDLPSDKPFLNLTFYDKQHRLLYSQAMTLSRYPLVKGELQTLNIQLDAIMPTVDTGAITATLANDATFSELPGLLTPLSDAPMYFMQPVMTDVQNGWAEGDGNVLRTTDGGKTWLDASPQTLYLYGVGSSIANHDYAFVGNHAWVAKPAIFQNHEMEATVWRTDNGGQTWIRTTLPITEKWELSSFTALNFSDEKHGFIFVISNSNEKRSLYTTSDGGNHWARVPDITGLDLVYPNIFTFLDSKNGWFTTSKKLLHTVDGGRTWTPVPITIPNPYNQSEYNYYFEKAPQFFGENHQDGFLTVEIASSKLHVVIVYTTNDGGKSWNPSGEAPVNYSTYIKFIEDNVAYSLSPKIGSNNTYQIYLTTDRGQSWTLKSEFEIPTPQAIYKWQFLNLSDGWISDGYPGNVYTTHDGGITWTHLRISDMNARQH